MRRVSDDVAGNICQAPGRCTSTEPLDAHHVRGCHLTQETRERCALDRTSGNIYRVLPRGLHSSTFRVNAGAYGGIGGALRGFQGVFRGFKGGSWGIRGCLRCVLCRKRLMLS